METKTVKNGRSLFSWSRVAGLGFTAIIFYWMFVIWNITEDLNARLNVVTAQRTEIQSLIVEMKNETLEWKNLLLRSKNRDTLDKNWSSFEAQYQKVSRMAGGIIQQNDIATLNNEMNAFVDTHAKDFSQYRSGMELLSNNNFAPDYADAATKDIERPLLDHLAAADSAMRDENKRISESSIAKAQDQIEQSLFALGFVAILAVWIPR